MAKASGGAETIWDGYENAYIAPDRPTIDGPLPVWSGSPAEVDPVTYEVVRHALWQITAEMGATIVRASGSPFTIYGEDYNTGLFTAMGDWIYFGPFVQYLASAMDSAIKWTLENRAGEPGINEGDMFLTNDPWIAGNHQSDVTLICPVFWEGEVLAWVGSAIHVYDIGGTVPGGWTASARDIYDEAVPIPPIKMVENGRIRRDTEDWYLRQSRNRDLLALDLRAKIAANNVGRERFLEIVRAHGPEVIAGVVKRIGDSSENAFVERLQQIPDGTWREVNYIEFPKPGPGDVAEVVMTLTKSGDTLTFANEGTAAQRGAANTTFIGWKGGIIAGFSPLFLFDQLYAIGGALKHVDFEPTPGTLNCCTFPAAASCGPPIQILLTYSMAKNVMSKMLSAAPELRMRGGGADALSQFPLSVISGTDERSGKPFGGLTFDAFMFGIGAFSERDGIHTGGCSWDPKVSAPNIEFNEQVFPILYLERKELVDSGGAGTYVGGSSVSASFIPHRATELIHTSGAGGAALPSGFGIFGGHPGCTNKLTLRVGTDVLERFLAGSLPDPESLSVEDRIVFANQEGLAQGATDVFTLEACGAAGYGDPLDRDPDAVSRDACNDFVSVAAARELFGVVLEPDSLKFDRAATDRLRDEIRRRRLEQGQPPRAEATGSTVTSGPRGARVHEYLTVVEAGDGHGLELRCRCGRRLCAFGESYKYHALIAELPLRAANLRIEDPSRFIDEEFVFRQFYCPGCATLLETEVAAPGSPPVDDLWIEPRDLASPPAR